MRLFWTDEALADREAIYDYIEVENPLAAINLDDLFSEAAGRLMDHPKSGRLGRVAGTRELVIHTHYVLVYDLANDTIRILRLLHTSRLWPSQDP